VELLDNREMVRGLCLLKRKRGPSGKDVVDHPRTIGGGVPHDDLANAICGMIVMAHHDPCLPGFFFAWAGVSSPTLSWRPWGSAQKTLLTIDGVLSSRPGGISRDGGGEFGKKVWGSRRPAVGMRGSIQGKARADLSPTRSQGGADFSLFNWRHTSLLPGRDRGL